MKDKKRIKILHLRSSGGFYGAEAVILMIVRELDQMGCKSYVLCINNLKNPHAELVDKAHKNGIEASFVDSIGALDLECIKEIRKKLKEGEFDVLHCHDYKASIYGFLASWCMSPKRVVTNHGWINVNWKLSLYQFLEGFLYNKFNRVIAVSEKSKKDIRRYIVHKSKIEVITNGIDCKSFDFQPISENGEGKIENRKIFGLTEDDVVIGIIGRLSLEKGHEYLLRAFAKLLAKENQKWKWEDSQPEADPSLAEKARGESQNPSSILHFPSPLKLLIIGDGLLEDSLKSFCRELELSFIDLNDDHNEPSISSSSPSVIFAGVQTDMPVVYSVIDIFAMPSLSEGLPMALLEAMVSEVPVIVTPVGQIPEIIKDGETGFLVEPRDVEGLTVVLERVMEHGRWKMESQKQEAENGEAQRQNLSSVSCYPLSLKEITDNARKLVEEDHSSQAMAKKYLEMYEWLVE